MTTTEELLKEYANIAGKNDAESEARKKEILSWLENHADEESIEKAKEFGSPVKPCVYPKIIDSL